MNNDALQLAAELVVPIAGFQEPTQLEFAAALKRLHARVQELEADNESLRRINDAQDKALAELEAQVQRAAEIERAAILMRVKNRACAGALLVKDFQEIVNDRGQNTIAAIAAQAKQGGAE